MKSLTLVVWVINSHIQFLVPFDFSKSPAISLRGYSDRRTGLKNKVRWFDKRSFIKSINDTDTIKLFKDENMFKLSDILLSAKDGQNKSIESPDYWVEDIGMGSDGLYNILNWSMYSMGTAESSMLMKIESSVPYLDISIFDPDFFYHTKIKVAEFTPTPNTNIIL